MTGWKRSTWQPRQDVDGFTIVVCRGSGCAHSELAVVDPLRTSIRRCPHGVLVISGCVLGPMLCRAWNQAGADAQSVFALVQPCDTERRPAGPVVPVGPLRTRDDVDVLCRWLEAGELTRERLATRLLPDPAPTRRASWN